MVQPGMNLSETAMPLFPCLAGRLHAFPGSRFRFHSQIASSRSQIFCDLTVMICQWAKLFTQLMRSRMDDLLWRIEWIGGVGYNTSVPSEPQIDVCLAQLPKGEKNPLSARARSSQVEKRTVKIGVGLLPYVWIGSVWQKRRPVITNLSTYRGRVSIDATSLRMVALGMATSR